MDLYLFNEQIDQDGQGYIVAVVSPLLNLISEQVKSLIGLGIQAVNLSDVESQDDRRQVERWCFIADDTQINTSSNNTGYMVIGSHKRLHQTQSDPPVTLGDNQIKRVKVTKSD